MKSHTTEKKHIFRNEKLKICEIVKVIYSYKTQTKKLLIESFGSNYEKFERQYDIDYKDYWLQNGFIEVFLK